MAQAPRPLGFGEILDGSFTLYRRNFTTFFGAALTPHLPLVIFWLLAPLFLGGVADAGVFMEVVPILLLPYSVAATLLVMGALTSGFAEAYGGGLPVLGGMLGHGLRRWLSLAVASMLAYILVVFGILLFVIPGLILLAMFFAVPPVVVVEGRGPIAAMGRSRVLSRGGRMRILGIMLVGWIITLLPAFALWTVAGVGMGMSGVLEAASLAQASDLWVAAMVQAASIVVTALTWPFLMGVTVLLYFDRRARTEAPDLESAAAALRDSTV